MHGWGGSTDSFRGVAEALKNDCRCTLVDFYGFGQSPAERVYTMDDYAAAVREVLDALGCSEAALVAHSFGGRVALLLASDPRVRKIVLTDAAGLKPRPTLRKICRKLRYRWKKLFGADTTDCGSPDYRALSPVMRETFKNVVNCHLDALPHTITVPTLIVWGKRDRETPPYMAKKLHRSIRDSGLIFLDGGHFCYIEAFDRYVRILRAFL